MHMTAIMPAPARDDDRATSYVGMTIALASWLMLFATLFLAYVVLRVQQPVWPPPGTGPLPLAQALANTFVLGASSFALAHGARQQSAGKRGALARGAWAAIGLGACFVALQVLLWMRTLRSGIVPQGVFGSVFYALTVLHALHVLGGLAALAWLAARAGAAGGAGTGRLPVQPVSMYWHFVDLVWIIMFVAIFVL
jgi:cytochrome c oxidase subunit 3